MYKKKPINKRYFPRNHLYFWFGVLLFGLPFAMAQADAVDQLNAFFANVRTMRADFQQTVIDARFEVVQDASGTLVMHRPGKFRWDYTVPYEQLIVADGKNLWVYDKDLEQITVKPMSQVLGNTPAMLLSGGEPLEKSFRITDLKNEGEDTLQWVELLPKARDTNFVSVRLGFDGQDLKVMELMDTFDQLTRLQFSNIKINPEVNDSVFEFTPPKGVDVIGEVK
jgi:outer membrane lipoprotein carrier protein